MLLLSLAAEDIYSLLITDGESSLRLRLWECCTNIPASPRAGASLPLLSPQFLAEGGAVGSVGAQVGLKAPVMPSMVMGWGGWRMVVTPVL